jgi:hypothetical protein
MPKWLRPGGELREGFDLTTAPPWPPTPTNTEEQHPGADEIPVVRDPAPGLYETIHGRPLPSYAELRARYADPADAPEVDFRDLLKDDGKAWATQIRLSVLLGRKYLATKLVDQLDPETSTTLADRLEDIISRRVAERLAEIDQRAAQMVDDKLAQIQADKDAWVRGVTRERFSNPSRFA